MQRYITDVNHIKW